MPTSNSVPQPEPSEGDGRYLAGTGLVGTSSAFRSLLRQADARGIKGHGPLLVVGEPGTGKSHLARALHSGTSRRKGPFLHLPLGSIAPDRLELEIFGTRNGEPDGDGVETPHILALAEGGTVFLHGLPHLPLPLQLRLARSLESEAGGPRNLPCRVMATALPGGDMGGEELLLPSLRKVLSQGRLEVPPLRNREGDLPLLARHFLRVLPVRGEGPRASLTPSALEALRQHLWPGNVRELRRTMEMAAHRADTPLLGAEQLKVQEGRRLLPLAPRLDPESPGEQTIRIPPEGLTLAEVEAEAVAAALRITKGNRSRASRILNVSRPTLTRKIRLYELEV